MYIDGFGNAITNIRPDHLDRRDRGFHVRLRGIPVAPVTHYSGAAPGMLSCLFNSSGYLEIFVPRGNAAELFSIRRGDEVSVTDIEST
jgi:S-adenosylmethionine hydrolase